jgi:ATP-dependent DNA helicase PIF1
MELVKTKLSQGSNVLLHCAGGMGKSFLIKELVGENDSMMSVFTEQGQVTKKLRQTALTGVAAINLSVAGHPASTLHRWAGIGLGKGDRGSLLKKVMDNPKARNNWNETGILIVDEISMLGKTLFEKLDILARDIRRNDKPFGGMQVVFSGDFLQLPPVGEDWVFLSERWKDLNLVPVVLTEPKRFTDVNFFEMLMKIRRGEVDQSTAAMLKSRLVLPPSSNKITPTILYSTKKDVSSYNLGKLQAIKEEATVFEAEDSFLMGNKAEKPLVETTFSRKFGASHFEACMNILDGVAPKQLLLKKGAQVMLKYNVDFDAGLVNGSRGVVEGFEKDGPIVSFINGVVRKITKISWEFSDAGNKGSILIRHQIPLILAWSLTIHSTQGCTLDYALVDLGNEIFSPGQAYVALSRVRNIQGLFIKALVLKRIQADKKALEYVEEIEDSWKRDGDILADADLLKKDVLSCYDMDFYKSLFDMVLEDLMARKIKCE